jgi:hypothetical protein
MRTNFQTSTPGSFAILPQLFFPGQGLRGGIFRREYVRDGSVLVVDRSVGPKHGRLVVVEESGEFAVQRTSQ